MGRSQYSPLGTNDLHQVEDGNENPSNHIPKKWIQISFYAWLATIGLWFPTVVLVGLAMTTSPTKLQCGKELSTYSPAWEAVQYEQTTFENDFFHKNEYRGQPTPELEEAWLALWNFGAVNVPIDKLSLLNKSESQPWRRVPPEHGGGVYGGIEVFHQLHCLDMVRQYTYKDQYDYSHLVTFDGPDYLVRAHVDHCIETLRINLMCTGDVTPYLNLKDDRRLLGSEPEFNTLHTCRNFEKLQKWNRDNAIPAGRKLPNEDAKDGHAHV